MDTEDFLQRWNEVQVQAKVDEVDSDVARFLDKAEEYIVALQQDPA